MSCFKLLHFQGSGFWASSLVRPAFLAGTHDMKWPMMGLYKYGFINPNVKCATLPSNHFFAFWKKGVHETSGSFFTSVSNSKHFLCPAGQWFEWDRGSSDSSDSQFVLKGTLRIQDWTTEVLPAARLMCTTQFRRTCCQLQQSGYLSGLCTRLTISYLYLLE